MDKLPLEIVKRLYARFCTIYGDKFVKNYHNQEFITLWWEDWSDGLVGIDIANFKEALNHCKMNLEWPPSLPEFRKICEKVSGFPGEDEAFKKALRREFSHPLIKIAFDKIGEWEFKHDVEAVLKRKFHQAYEDAVIYCRTNPEKISNFLLVDESKKIEVNAESIKKIPAAKEILSFRENLAKHQKSENEYIQKNKTTHPAWEKEKYTVNHSKFDAEVYEERRNYLIKLPQYAVSTLSRDDLYDRERFLRETEGEERAKRFREESIRAGDGKNFNNQYNSPGKSNPCWNKNS